MPPSLRRTFSSPSVRPSPYPTALSHSHVGSGRVYGQGNRRSSGSETSRRRVLADLEWWRVVDGQHTGEAEQETEENDQHQDQSQSAEAPSGSVPSLGGDAGVERPSTPSTRIFESLLDMESLPTSQFAALSIAPRTPPRSARRYAHTFESSSSSLESTPEANERPIGCMHLSMIDLDVDFADVDALPALPPFSLACSPPGAPFTRPFPTRTHSFDFSALLNDSAGRFADIGFASHDIFN